MPLSDKLAIWNDLLILQNNSEIQEQISETPVNLFELGEEEAPMQNSAPYQNITNSLFNTKLYYDLYPDLRNAFGYNESALRNHWLNCGIKEGRIGSLVFDAKYYLDKYSDLKKAFGNNYQLAYDHFKSNGIKEGRRASMYFDVKYYLLYLLYYLLKH